MKQSETAFFNGAPRSSLHPSLMPKIISEIETKDIGIAGALVFICVVIACALFFT